MGKAKCPMCRGDLELKEGPWSDESSALWLHCEHCGWCSGCDETSSYDDKAEDVKVLDERVAPLAYFDPRPTLPTEAEEAAHRERHGDGAGWMVGLLSNNGRWMWGDKGLLVIGQAILDAQGGGELLCYPHVNGRPVGWPEVPTNAPTKN